MTRALARAARGPVLLITLGVLMAYDQMGGWSFSRTWPVLLIVFGIFKLLERVSDRELPAPPAAGGGN